MTKKPIDYSIAILCTAVFAWAAYRLPGWLPTFTTSSYGVALWAILISSGVQIVGNILFIGYDRAWFKSLVETLMQLVSLISTAIIYYVWPFDFAAVTSVGSIETVVRLGFAISLIVMVVVVVVGAVKTLGYVVGGYPVEPNQK